VLGIEPTANTARAALQKGIRTMTPVFGPQLPPQLVKKGIRADLLLGNSGLAYVPAIVGFVKGIKTVLEEEGVFTMEFPHLLQLVNHNQFDTIYHEHFSYFSFFTGEEIFKAQNLVVFDEEQLPTHGGSHPIYVKQREDNAKGVTPGVQALHINERAFGNNKKSFYEGFFEKALVVKLDITAFLVEQKS
jgi:C-methyltransferase C-terminal domain